MILLKLKGLNKYTKIDLITEKSSTLTDENLKNLLVEHLSYSFKDYRNIRYEINFSDARAVLINPETKVWKVCLPDFEETPNELFKSVIDLRDSDIDPEYIFSSNDFSELFNNKHKKF